MKSASLLLAASAFALSATPASATALVLDGGWTSFSFGDVGSSWDQEFTFTAAGNVVVNVTDAFLSGDQFEVFINAVSAGQTSAPGTTGDQAGGDYDLAFSDSRWSSGSYALGPGSYTFTGLVTASPFGGGGGAIQLVSARVGAVPEPSTWMLLIAGLGVIGYALRTRRQPTTRVSVSYS